MAISTVRARTLVTAAILTASLSSVFSPSGEAQAQACFAYVGNNNPSVSIYSVDGAIGSLTDVGTASLGPMSSAFSLAVNPSQTFLYVGDNAGTGTWGFGIDTDSGALTALAGSPFPITNSLSLAVDPSGGFLIAALGSSVASFRIDPVTGGLDRVDTVFGGTPWSLTFEPSGQYVYVANVNSNYVSGFRLDAVSGALTAVPGSPFSAGATPNRVVAEPSGRFLYVSNGNGSNLNAYSINPETGALSSISGSPFPTGVIPYAMAVDPSGTYLYVSNYGNIIHGFSIDPETGALTQLGGSPFPSTTALDLSMDPSGQFLYAANHDAKKVTVLAVDQDTGALSILDSVASPGFPLAINLVTCSPVVRQNSGRL